MSERDYFLKKYPNCPKCNFNDVKVLSYSGSYGHFRCDKCDNQWSEYATDPDDRFDQPLNQNKLERIKREAVMVCTHRHCEVLCHYLLTGHVDDLQKLESDLVDLYKKYVKEENRVKQIAYNISSKNYERF